MENINYEIEKLEQQLEELKQRRKLSIESIKKEQGNWSYVSEKDICRMILCLIEGDVYKSFEMYPKFELLEATKWDDEKNNWYLKRDYYLIHKRNTFSGFICKKEYLFEATSHKHKSMWIKSVAENHYEKSFENFKEELKNTKKLLEVFDGIEEYENKELGIEKHYIYF